VGKKKKPCSTSTEADRVLRNEFKKLKSENKHLRRELQKLTNKKIEPTEEIIADSKNCNICKTGNLIINNLGIKSLISCSNGCKEARKVLKNG
jgi:hypothetical protein